MMNVLILGAGLMQIPAILSAKQLGYKVCVVDADKNAVGVPKADEFKVIDLKDREGILKYASELSLKENGGLEAVFTAGTDFSASVSYVCEKLGLQAHDFESALNASIKTRMRSCFEKQNVPSPGFFQASQENLKDISSLAQKITETISFPFVVKPVDNMGARGCRMVRNLEEFPSAIKTAVESSRTGNAIIEEYMEGPEYSIDALIHNGTLTVTGFAIRHIKYPPYFIEVGHTMPAVLDKKVHDQLISVFALGAKSLGLTEGAAKADIKFTAKGPMIGEIAARLSGGYMSGWTYPYASDLNLTKQGLLIACGKEPEELIKNRIPVDFETSELCKDADKPYELFEVPCKRTSSERAWMSIPGTVEYIENITEFTDKAVFDTLPRATVSIGSEVDFPRNNVEKCGNIIAVSHMRDISIQSAENAVSNVFITLKPDNPKTENFLKGTENADELSFPPSAFGSEPALDELNDLIPENAATAEYIPEILKSKKYEDLIDWNYNTLKQTVQKFDILRPKHPTLEAKKFWKAILRGGLQAAVYVSDTVELLKK